MSHQHNRDEPENLFELAWDYAPCGMFAVDCGDLTIFNVNRAAEAMCGYGRGELIGMRLSDLHPEVEREQVAAEIQKANQQPFHLLPGFHLRHKDGHSVPVAISSSKTTLLNGRAVLSIVYHDMTEMEKREDRIVTKSWAVQAYAGAAIALWRKGSSERFFEEICQAITNESIYLLAWIGLAEEGPGKPVRVMGATGSALGYMEGLQVCWSEDGLAGQGPSGLCIRTGNMQIVEDTETSAAFEPWRQRARQFGIRSSLSVSFAANNGGSGALVVYAARPRAFLPDAIEVFVHMAEQIGSGLRALDQERLLESERAHTANAERQLKEALSGMVAPILTAMEMRDPYTVGHQGRVAEIACAIGDQLGWTADRIQGLRVAAQVHDIGKISIPAEILTKPGQLNAAERAMINWHAEMGYTILKDIPFPWPVAEIVRQHHEKVDGSGYPRGLKGDEILPEAKVLAVADIVEAMASYRPYRQGVKLHLVLREIEKEAGTLLDGDAVRVCLDLFREKHFMLPGWLRRP